MEQAILKYCRAICFLSYSNTLDNIHVFIHQQDGASIHRAHEVTDFFHTHHVLLDGTVDAKGYVTVLQHYLLPVIEQYFHSHPCIFQQDNAAVHTAYGA
ncbi:hypothetical protein EON65_48800 [archaeon]|nr:MAG: hypothetical protein EON65_48800 [archaeon]